LLNKVAKHVKQGTLANTVYKKTIGKGKKRIITGYKRDLYNISRYGWTAPRFAECVWVNPHNCNMFIPGDIIREFCGIAPRAASGMVLRSSWPFEQALQITEHPKIKCCIDHWVNSIPWEKTGVYEYMEKLIEQRRNGVDGCKNKEDIVRRYEELDLIFEQIKKEGRMKTRYELTNSNFREMGGPYIHIGRDGKPFFGGGGFHRFAIAHILQIPYPAQIGCVHVSAIPYLKEYRKG